MIGLTLSRMTRTVLAVVAALLLLGGCGSTTSSDSSDPAPAPTAAAPSTPKAAPNTGHIVARKQFGEKWPLTVEGGNVGCFPAGGGLTSAVFTSRQGKRYALNGTAAAKLHLPPIAPLQADDGSGLKKDIAPLLDICLS